MSMQKNIGKWLGAAAVGIAIVGAYFLGQAGVGTDSASTIGEAQPEISPTQPIPDRDAYFPGTEALAEDEMRVTACGTGMPNARPSQAAACFLVELGNGDKFIFDIGTGSMERLSALNIPFDYLDKLFVGHLHTDHVGDFDALWVGGSIGNRQRPLRIWGPSGSEERYGTRYFVDHIQKAYTWDTGSRLGNVNTEGLQIEVHEFDYRAINQAIYEENGVTITTLPAIHALDGSVSFILTWNGLKFAFSSDTYPNQWWLEHARGADIVIHECFLTPELLVTKQNWATGDALNVASQVHTSPPMFGAVMARIRPRMAVAYHFFNDFDTAPRIEAEIRQQYDGPLSLARDFMVWNVRPAQPVQTRMAIISEDVWPLPSVTEQLAANPDDRIGMSDFIMGGRVIFQNVIDEIYAGVNERFGTDIPTPPPVEGAGTVDNRTPQELAAEAE